MVKADLSREDDRIHLVEQTVETYGPVDILVNDAAVTFFIPVETFPKKRFDLMFEVQVWAPLHLSQLVLPSMRERKQGWIVNISSGAAIHPQRPYARRGGGTIYGMCKAALERFTTGLASEVYDDNVAVNVISPGLVDTPGVAVHGRITEANKDRVTPIEYIAEAVYQLSIGDSWTQAASPSSTSASAIVAASSCVPAVDRTRTALMAAGRATGCGDGHRPHR